MVSVWVKSVHHSLNEALELLAAAVQDCPDDLWRSPMWWVHPSEIVEEVRDVSGEPVTDAVQRDVLVQRWSAPWSVAWHALEVLDYDLTAELSPWVPPDPFAGKPHWRTFTSLPDPWAQSEIGEYVTYCRGRVRDTLVDMTEEKAATPLPPTHRYAGHPHASIVTSLVGHTTAHAMQIRQFITPAVGSPDGVG